MAKADMAPNRYLAEWYRPHLCGEPIADIARRLRCSTAAMDTGPEPPELLYALEVPEDAYVFGVFTAGSAEQVTVACAQAGLPADRVTAAVEAPLDSAGPDRSR